VFRPDLVHRIDVFPLFLPAVAELPVGFPGLVHSLCHVTTWRGAERLERKTFSGGGNCYARKYLAGQRPAELRKHRFERLVLLAAEDTSPKKRGWRCLVEKLRVPGTRKLGRELSLSAPKPSKREVLLGEIRRTTST